MDWSTGPVCFPKCLDRWWSIHFGFNLWTQCRPNLFFEDTFKLLSDFGTYSRIDYILTSDLFSPYLQDANIGVCVWSDHAGIDCTISMHNKQHTRPAWRLNSNLLFLEPMRMELKKEIELYLGNNSTSGVSSHVMWDAMKAVIRGKAIAITSAYKKEKQKYRSDLLQNIRQLEQQHKKSCNAKVYRQLLMEHKKPELWKWIKLKKNILYLKQKYWFRRPKFLKLISWKVCQWTSTSQIRAIQDRVSCYRNPRDFESFQGILSVALFLLSSRPYKD